ncbi:MAG: hypothetical protein Tsb009_39770 [Planctomycetaceae bacterium]
MTRRQLCFTFLSVVLAVVSNFDCETSAGDWSGFRGPHGTGIAQETALPTEWSKTKNVKWRMPLPGPGNSSPIVSNGRVFITCAEENGTKRNLYCLDRKTGKPLWVQTVVYEKPEKMHKTNPYCGSTPAADGKRVVVWHGSAGLFCYDFSGKELWKADLGEFTHIWGYGSSPVLHDEKIYLNCGPGKRTFLIAIDLNTGKELWKKDEPGGADTRNPRMVGSWSTPVIAKVNGEFQVICSMPTRVVAYQPDSGKILWTLDGLRGPNGDLVYTSPLISGNIGVTMSGYTGPIVAFKLGGRGNVTKTNTLWKSKGKQPQRIGSGVIIGQHIFMANAGPGTAQCFDLKTGNVKWQTRLAAAAHWGSLCYVDNKLYVTNQAGTTFVFHPNPDEFELIARNSLGEPSNSTPAFSNGEIFLRTSKAIYCISK